jgi:hypothetical protein
LEAASERMRAVKAVKVTLGVSIALTLAVVAVALTRAPARVVRASSVGHSEVGATVSDEETCQANEVLPAGVSAIRVWLLAFYGSRVRVTASSGSQVLAEGTRAGDWTGGSVTVPVTPLKRTASQVTLCIAVGPNSQPIFTFGREAPAREAAVATGEGRLGGRMGVEYLAGGQGSWWSRILPVARRMGLGHALSGAWVVLLIAALVGAAGLLAVRITLRELP